GRYLELWLIRVTADGLKAQDLNFYLRRDIHQIKILNLSDVTNQKIFLLTTADWLRIIHVLPDGRTKILIEKYDGVKSFGVSTVQDSVRIVVNIDSGFEGRKLNVYEWNMIEEDFDLMANTFEVFGKEIEQDVFVEHKYLQVANSIEEFLLTPLDEPIEWYSCNNDSGCVYSPPFYIPYFRYLQGLSYEQLGDFDKARDVYYELWNEYPDNVFGVVASMKLELVK
ncbi:MAG TPA: hypothetical protein DIW23_08250, partial [Anaerolineae bacterium]|nr:hypothetical protein [Anaerolineae bacterium]